MYHAVRIDKEKVNSDLLTAIVFDNGGEGIEELGTQFVCSFGEGVTLEEIKTLLNDYFQLSETDYDVHAIPDENWMENWKKSFKPIYIGDKFIVKPTWEMVEDNDRHIIDIDAKMAFGTGTHETTQLIMETMPRYIKPEDCLLDAGTGSGILAIAAHRLGLRTIKAFDVDPVAIENAIENVELNETPEINIFTGEIDDVSEAYDIVFANIISSVLIDLKEKLIERVKENGILILSGILDIEKDQVLNAYKAIEHLETVQKGEWVALVFRNK